MKGLGLRPNIITFLILIVAREKWSMWICCQTNDLVRVLAWPNLFSACFCRKDDMEAAQMLLSQTKKDGASPTLIMCWCIIGDHIVGFCQISHFFVLAFKSMRINVASTFTFPHVELCYQKTIVSLSDVCKYIENWSYI
jgi:hypothetical protein